MIEKFNAEHDDIEIQYDIVPGDGYGDRLLTSFSSGEGYDIFASGEGDFYKWVGANMPLSLKNSFIFRFVRITNVSIFSRFPSVFPKCDGSFLFLLPAFSQSSRRLKFSPD